MDLRILGCTDPQYTHPKASLCLEQPECHLLLLGGNCSPYQRLPPHSTHSHRFLSQRLWGRVPSSHLWLLRAHSPERKDKTRGLFYP